ncbi:MBL fold metallo-hydrolase [Conexibacter stalactiti]|uniref:MBL fold metallo-hydrolase n=1 Tax=Conexibacter stalactiti TaxID=1940611 RepID=A0ABU4HNR4_9ACTN|nr:MBL fold metallo-hydrolase [Conexibacter stalactiti]MDW5594337.1 MBL fold metallo-hydrolase [Conexibacter stalactiti]MEC5034979.1 MBL fold metallo-hydrolase [Conexibacter stalactiti]
MRAIDVHFLGIERVICSWQVGDVLVDPGPASSLPTLLDALGDWRPRALLLTHIHLDHAGGAGLLARRWPELEVYVHERGAPHVIDPSKLLASAGRLYGEDNMKRLWGEIAPVPAERVHALSGGETLPLAGGVRVAYTPGHASHHVAYLHEESGRAFVGDVAGVRIPPSDLVIAPTPPPDVDVEAWERSLDLIAEWRPTALGLTHFGGIDDPGAQLEATRTSLRDLAGLARGSNADVMENAVRGAIEREADGPATVQAYEAAVPPSHLYMGLERYWRKRAEREAAAESR